MAVSPLKEAINSFVAEYKSAAADKKPTTLVCSDKTYKVEMTERGFGIKVNPVVNGLKKLFSRQTSQEETLYLDSPRLDHYKNEKAILEGLILGSGGMKAEVSAFTLNKTSGTNFCELFMIAFRNDPSRASNLVPVLSKDKAMLFFKRMKPNVISSCLNSSLMVDCSESQSGSNLSAVFTQLVNTDKQIALRICRSISDNSLPLLINRLKRDVQNRLLPELSPQAVSFILNNTQTEKAIQLAKMAVKLHEEYELVSSHAVHIPPDTAASEPAFQMGSPELPALTTVELYNYDRYADILGGCLPAVAAEILAVTDTDESEFLFKRLLAEAKNGAEIFNRFLALVHEKNHPALESMPEFYNQIYRDNPVRAKDIASKLDKKYAVKLFENLDDGACEVLLPVCSQEVIAAVVPVRFPGGADKIFNLVGYDTNNHHGQQETAFGPLQVVFNNIKDVGMRISLIEGISSDHRHELISGLSSADLADFIVYARPDLAAELMCDDILVYKLGQLITAETDELNIRLLNQIEPAILLRALSSRRKEFAQACFERLERLVQLKIIEEAQWDDLPPQRFLFSVIAKDKGLLQHLDVNLLPRICNKLAETQQYELSGEIIKHIFSADNYQEQSRLLLALSPDALKKHDDKILYSAPLIQHCWERACSGDDKLTVLARFLTYIPAPRKLLFFEGGPITQFQAAQVQCLAETDVKSAAGIITQILKDANWADALASMDCEALFIRFNAIDSKEVDLLPCIQKLSPRDQVRGVIALSRDGESAAVKAENALRARRLLNKLCSANNYNAELIKIYLTLFFGHRTADIAPIIASYYTADTNQLSNEAGKAARWCKHSGEDKLAEILSVMEPEAFAVQVAVNLCLETDCSQWFPRLPLGLAAGVLISMGECPSARELFKQVKSSDQGELLFQVRQKSPDVLHSVNFTTRGLTEALSALANSHEGDLRAGALCRAALAGKADIAEALIQTGKTRLLLDTDSPISPVSRFKITLGYLKNPKNYESYKITGEHLAAGLISALEDLRKKPSPEDAMRAIIKDITTPIAHFEQAVCYMNGEQAARLTKMLDFIDNSEPLKLTEARKVIINLFINKSDNSLIRIFSSQPEEIQLRTLECLNWELSSKVIKLFDKSRQSSFIDKLANRADDDAKKRAVLSLLNQFDDDKFKVKAWKRHNHLFEMAGTGYTSERISALEPGLILNVLRAIMPKSAKDAFFNCLTNVTKAKVLMAMPENDGYLHYVISLTSVKELADIIRDINEYYSENYKDINNKEALKLIGSLCERFPLEVAKEALVMSEISCFLDLTEHNLTDMSCSEYGVSALRVFYYMLEYYKNDESGKYILTSVVRKLNQLILHYQSHGKPFEMADILKQVPDGILIEAGKTDSKNARTLIDLLDPRMRATVIKELNSAL